MTGKVLSFLFSAFSNFLVSNEGVAGAFFNFSKDSLVEFKLNDENGDDVEAISIVKDPAIEKSFQLFKAVELFNKSTKEQFKAQGDKQELSLISQKIL